MTRITFVAMILSLAGFAMADAPPPPDWTPKDVEVEVTAGIWQPRPTGTAKLGAGATIDLIESLDFRDREMTPLLEVSVRRLAKWELLMGGSDFDTTVNNTTREALTFGPATFAQGDAYRGTLGIRQIFGEVSLDLDLQQPLGSDRAKLRIAPVIGTQFVSVDQTLQRPGGPQASAGGDFAIPYVGGSVELHVDTTEAFPILQAVKLQASGGFGPAIGGDGGVAWHIRANLRIYVHPNVSLIVGYRLLELVVERDDWEFGSGLQGMFFGASIRF